MGYLDNQRKNSAFPCEVDRDRASPRPDRAASAGGPVGAGGAAATALSCATSSSVSLTSCGAKATTSAQGWSGSCAALIYIIDAQDDSEFTRLHDIANRAHRINPNIAFDVFIHKVDGDLFLSDEHKVDCQRDILLKR